MAEGAEMMRARGIWTTQHHFLLATLICRSSHLSHLKQLQAHLLALGHGQSQFFSFKLLRFCAASLGNLNYARLIFDSLHYPDVFIYTAIITAYSTSSQPLPALQLFDQMLRKGQPKPNEFVYPRVLKSCSDMGSPALVKMVDAIVWKSGFRDYCVVKTSLVDGYSRCGELETARRVFDELSHRNLVSWTAMITAYTRVGLVRDAVHLFDEMPERDVISWNAVIAGFTQNGFFTEAVEFFRKMVLAGTNPNQTTMVCVLSACGSLGMLRIGKSLHGYMLKNRIYLNSFVLNALVDLYGKCGSLKEAKWVFDNSSNRRLASWNSVINCFALHGKSEEAIVLFKEMEMAGQKPDKVTFVGVLNACTHGGLVEEGTGYFHSMIKYGIAPRIEHYGCVIDLLSRAGRFREVMDIIDGMDMEPDEVVWGSLLNGCRVHRNAELAEFAARKLLEMDPTSGDYGAMLANVYSEGEKWEEVRKLRKLAHETGRNKLPGCSWIEVDNKVFQFHSSDKSHPQVEKIHEILEGLAWAL